MVSATSTRNEVSFIGMSSYPSYLRNPYLTYCSRCSDIKPENLLFERIPIVPSKHPIHRPYDEEKEDEGEFTPGRGGGGIGRVKIADFGLSKIVWDEGEFIRLGLHDCRFDIDRRSGCSHSNALWYCRLHCPRNRQGRTVSYLSSR